MTTSRRGYFRYVTADVWRTFARDAALAVTVIVFVVVLVWVLLVLLSGHALDDAVTELIVPSTSDYQLPTI
jgi:hypothetical protein